MTREESTEEGTAGCSLQPRLVVFFFFLPLLLFSLDEVWVKRRTDFSLTGFCLVITTFPFAVLKLLLEFSGSSTINPAFTNDQYTSKQSLCTCTGLHVDFRAIRS